MSKITIPLQSAQTKTVRGSPQKLVNMYTVALATDNKEMNTVLYPTPGSEVFVNLSGAECRQGGMIEFHGSIYVVVDNRFVAIHFINGVVSVEEIGLLQSSTGPVCMAAIFDQILIVDGIQGYLYTKSTATYVIITDVSFPKDCTFVAAQDDYFMALVPNDNVFYLSTLSNGAEWPALRFASTNAKYDNLTGMLAMFGEFWMFCSKSTEVWFNAGDPLFPYQPAGSTFLNYGCGAPRTIKRSNTGAVWLGTGGNSGSGLVLFGNTATEVKVISTQAMHDQFSTYDNINDAFGLCYQMGGTEFYVLTFPTDGKSWQYCFDTGMWNELTSLNTDTVSPHGEPKFTRWKPNAYAYFNINNGVHLVGDYLSGKVLQLNDLVYTEDTNPIQRIIVTPNIEMGSKYISINSLELLMEPGQSTENGQGYLSQIGCETSRDGGFHWGNKRLISLGGIGDYNRRSKWNMLGIGRHITFRFTMSDPINFIVLGAEADVDVEFDKSSMRPNPNVQR